MYSFASYVGSNSSSCDGANVAYVSPIVSHTFEMYLDNDYVSPQDFENKQNELESKWEDNCQAEFDIANRKSFCFSKGNYAPSQWKESRSDIDQERDETIADLKDQGYTVRDHYYFSFYID